MPDISRVLCAIDLSEPSRRVLDCALWWARHHGADVSVLHVHHVPVTTPDSGGLHDEAARLEASLGPAPLDPAERGARQRDVEQFVDEARTDGLQIEVLLDEDARIADAIVARADALAADLVVVGAGTNPASEHPVLGRTTADVLRAAPCSVLVIPAPSANVANPCVSGLNRIMCAISLSDESRQVLDYAAGLATDSTAHLTVVHVVELFSEVAALAYDFDAHREARVQPACDEFVGLVAEVVGQDKPVQEVVTQGAASDELLKLATEGSADLIVVGREAGHRTRGGRSTGQAVARDARCPVLFVHADTPSVALRPDSTTGADVPLVNA